MNTDIFAYWYKMDILNSDSTPDIYDFEDNMYLFAYRIDMESLYEKCFPDKLYKYSKNNG